MTKFRILKKVSRTGRTEYWPQYKWLFWWMPIYGDDCGYGGMSISRKTRDEAMDVIRWCKEKWPQKRHTYEIEEIPPK